MSVFDDEPPTKEELAEAKALASRVDDLLAGQAMPAVLKAEERELAELGSMIHASYNPVSLDADRQASLIESALAQGAGVAKSGGDELAQARAKRIARWPFAVGGLVAAAAIALLMFRPGPKAHNGAPEAPVAQMMNLPQAQQSRPGDALIGEIARDDRAAAGGRIDRLYSDRLSGYRNLQYRKFVGER